MLQFSTEQGLEKFKVRTKKIPHLRTETPNVLCSQRRPMKPVRQVHSPEMWSQSPPFLHWHTWEQSFPKKPSGQPAQRGSVELDRQTSGLQAIFVYIMYIMYIMCVCRRLTDVECSRGRSILGCTCIRHRRRCSRPRCDNYMYGCSSVPTEQADKLQEKVECSVKMKKFVASRRSYVLIKSFIRYPQIIAAA